VTDLVNAALSRLLGVWLRDWPFTNPTTVRGAVASVVPTALGDLAWLLAVGGASGVIVAWATARRKP
jgi:hypothetical protein